jgi:hypothetical protein
MFVQVLFIGSGLAPSPVFLYSSIYHPFTGKRVNIKVLGEMYSHTANFSIPVAYYITKGIGSSLASKAVVPFQSPRFYLNANAYIRDTYSTNTQNGFFGGEPLLYSDVDGNNFRYFQNTYESKDEFIYKNVLLTGHQLEIMIISQSDTGGDRANDVLYRVLYLDIEPVN